MLFVYQSADMQRLYRRYGHGMLLLDATYRTCRYSLPLFFLAVKTNVNYQVVAAFITQQETTAAITEALNWIQSRNPEVMPKYAMVDFCEEEIQALEATFQGYFIEIFYQNAKWSTLILQ